jgi:hypothetical protein
MASTGTVDIKALENALRQLGMLYGAKQPLEVTMRGARTDEDAIRAYISMERPHLLQIYEFDVLVKMIQDARDGKADGSHGMEQFSPRK